MTRIGSETAYENDPIGFGGRPASQFICRHESPNPSVTPTQVKAGDNMDVSYRLTAAHVGDCAYYMSYDVDADLEDMTWFKIGNQKDCKSKTGEVHQIRLPEWLPGGPAVFRWEWYALHVYPTIEFYAQCSDIVVTPSANSISASSIPTYKVFENGKKVTLPENGNEGVGFRNAFSNGPQDMTGPACALNSDLNSCSLTAAGSLRHVVIGFSSTPAPSELSPPTPTSPPVASPTQPPTDSLPAPPTDSPVESPTESPVESPAAPPTHSPVESIAPPTDSPVESPTDAPTNPPVESPTNPPVESPTNPPVESPVASPTYPPVVSPTTPVDECYSGALYAHYAQCAGEGFTQKTGDCPDCPWGFQCYRKSKWYSNCNHSCPAGLGWDCEGDNATPPAPVASPTTPPSGPPSSEACPNKEFDTCGGFGRSGATCCPPGMTCTVYSIWHSQCMKN